MASDVPTHRQAFLCGQTWLQTERVSLWMGHGVFEQIAQCGRFVLRVQVFPTHLSLRCLQGFAFLPIMKYTNRAV